MRRWNSRVIWRSVAPIIWSISIDTAYGIALGSTVAAAILLLIGWQWSGVTAGLAATASLGPAGWALLLALPLLAIALAALTARQTLLAALKKIL